MCDFKQDFSTRITNQSIIYILQNLVDGFGIEALKRLARELLQRQPAVFADGEIVVGAEQPPPNPDPPQNVADWCKCGQSNNWLSIQMF